MPGPIILAMDGTSIGETAIPFAVALAQQAGANLSVTEVQATAPKDNTSGNLRLRTLVERYAWTGSAVNTISLTGDPIPALLAYSERVRASLIIAAAQTPPTLRRVFSEQVADGLIRFAKVPVVVCSPSALARPQPRQLHRILIALDGSPFAEHAVAAVRQIAGRAEIILLQAICSSEVVLDDQPLATAIPLYLANQQRVALDYLNGVADELRGAGLRVTVAVTEGTWPGATIVNESVRRQVSLLALATHGRTGFARRALGSCAAEVLRLAPMPVLIAGPNIFAPGEAAEWPAPQRTEVAL